MIKNLENIEAKLRAEEERFQAIFYGSESAMVIFKGPNFEFEMFNKAYEEIYPTRKLIIGKSFLELVPELKDSPYPEILKGVYETGKPYIVKEGLAVIYNSHKDEKEERYFYTTFSRISFGSDGQFRILATPREVTDKVMARKELEATLIEKEREREMREKFVQALSHDLRTPLSVSKMCAQLIKTVGDDPKEVSEMVDRISSNLDRADRMIRDLLDASRIKAGVGVRISLSECELAPILNYIACDLKEVYGDRFEFKGPGRTVIGHWDDMAIHRMVENLAINAIKYGDPEKKITFALNACDEWAEIGVHNFGKTLTDEELQNLFDQYNRPRTRKNTGQTGWGIGLSIAKGLAEAHKGSIKVESANECGTTFVIRLPKNLQLSQEI